MDCCLLIVLYDFHRIEFWLMLDGEIQCRQQRHVTVSAAFAQMQRAHFDRLF